MNRYLSTTALGLVLATQAQASTQTAVLKSHVKLSSSCAANLKSAAPSFGADWANQKSSENTDMTLTCSRGVDLVVFFDNGKGQISKVALPQHSASYTLSLSELMNLPQTGDEPASADLSWSAVTNARNHHNHPSVTITY